MSKVVVLNGLTRARSTEPSMSRTNDPHRGFPGRGEYTTFQMCAMRQFFHNYPLYSLVFQCSSFVDKPKVLNQVVSMNNLQEVGRTSTQKDCEHLMFRTILSVCCHWDLGLL